MSNAVRAALLAFLRGLETAVDVGNTFSDGTAPGCVSCQEQHRRGHAHGCKLAALIDALEAEDEP